MPDSTPQAESPAVPLIVSSSPHFHTSETVESIMRWVLVALAPACLAALWFFGWHALRVLAVTTAASLAFEYAAAKAMKRQPDLKDCSAAVTGLLLGMNLPASTPWWICVIGAFVAIVFGKMLYGGLGTNPFNPALVGRVALLLAFPAALTAWPPARGAAPAQPSAVVRPATGATPLAQAKTARKEKQARETPVLHRQEYGRLFLGIGKPGSLGETCGLAIVLGGVLLIFLNIIRWQIPVCYLGTVFLITDIAWLCAPGQYAPPLFHLLTGGLLLGAFFMATDMVTTPLSRTGSVIFAVGCGILTSAIRLWGNYPEGVSFSILIMNAFTPLIDRFTKGRPFGMPKQKGLKFAK